MIAANLAPLRFDLFADIDRPRTAWMKTAALGRINRAGHVTFKYHALTLAFFNWIRDGNCG